jgi:Asp-tRNA(Asn)/Glu-tRNA(Gln) amidotransferase A subunit family amidase
MRSGNRNKRKRLCGASSPASSPEPLPPLDLTTEIEQSIDAREKVEAAFGQFNAQRDRIKPAFLLSLAREMQTTGVDANSAHEAFAAWHATETLAAQRGEALRQLLAMFKERVEQFKSRSGDEALAALRRIIERLAAERDLPGADANAINKRIDKLLAEVEALCAPSAAPPPEPKVLSNPSQRSSKGRDKPRPVIEK